MDIDEIRRSNIRALEKIHGPGLAKRAGMSPAQFYNLRDGAKDSKTGKPRGMRKETAWRLEDAAGVPRGFLDLPHNLPQNKPVAVMLDMTTVDEGQELAATEDSKEYKVEHFTSPLDLPEKNSKSQGMAPWPFLSINPEEWGRIPFASRQVLEQQIKALVPAKTHEKQVA